MGLENDTNELWWLSAEVATGRIGEVFGCNTCPQVGLRSFEAPGGQFGGVVL